MNEEPESFASPLILLEKQKYRPDFALALSVKKHTSPQQFGKVMAMTELVEQIYRDFNEKNGTDVMLPHLCVR